MKLCLALLIALIVQGCAANVALTAMNGFGACSPDAFRQAQYRQSSISTIYRGEPKMSVLQKLGRPFKSFQFRSKNGQSAEALTFKNTAMHCRTYADEKTLIIIQNGVVQGVGDEFYRSYRVSFLH